MGKYVQDRSWDFLGWRSLLRIRRGVVRDVNTEGVGCVLFLLFFSGKLLSKSCDNRFFKLDFSLFLPVSLLSLTELDLLTA